MSATPEKEIDLKHAFKNTLEADVKQYGDYLTLGKVFEAIGEGRAAAECYSAFIKNVLDHEKKKDGIDRAGIAALYGMTADNTTLNSFSGPVEFVLGAYYMSYLHLTFVTDIVRSKIRREKHPPKKLPTRPFPPAAEFLNWIKNPYGNRGLQAIAAFERNVKELALKSGDMFVSNIDAKDLFTKWRTAFTDSVPFDKNADFIFAL